MLQVVSDLTIRERLIATHRLMNSLQLEAAVLASVLERSRVWDDEGFNSAIDWLRFNCHLTSTAAADLVTVGEQPPRMPESSQAMYAGEIGFAHLKVMARTADAVSVSMSKRCFLSQKRTHRASSTTSACTTGIRWMRGHTPVSSRTRRSITGFT